MSIEGEVAAFLRSGPLQRINLSFGASRIWGEGYRRVADAIERRVSAGHYISVQYNTIMGAIGCGNYNESVGPNRVNLMQLPFRTMVAPLEYAVAVHEGTHAMQDWSRQPLVQADAEGAAYIAQMMFLRMDVYDHLPRELEEGAPHLSSRFAGTPPTESIRRGAHTEFPRSAKPLRMSWSGSAPTARHVLGSSDTTASEPG